MVFYDKCMRHIEMHLIEEEEDLSTAEVAGLDVYATETCDHCMDSVGVIEEGTSFNPFVVLLDDESEWIVCSSCADPVL
jgi:hypothetical protein